MQDDRIAEDASSSGQQAIRTKRSTISVSNRGHAGQLAKALRVLKLTHIQKAMPPEMMKKLRAAGPQGAQKMLQDMMGGTGGGGGGGGMDFGSMMRSMMGGGGGGGGMPDMAQMQGELV